MRHTNENLAALLGVLLAAFGWAGASGAQAAERRIPYQATLTPPLTATVQLILRIYDDPRSDLPEAVLWGPEYHDVAPDGNGNLQLLIGDSQLDTDENGIADLDEVDPTRAWYLDVSVGDGSSWTSLTPRQRVFPISHAYSADNVLDGSITAAKLAQGAVTSQILSAGAISGSQIGDNQVRATVVANATLTSREIANETLTQRELGTNSVLTQHIADGSVRGEELASGAITTSKLLNATIGTRVIAAGAVTTDKLDLSSTRTSEFRADTNPGGQRLVNLGAHRICALSLISLHEGSCTQTVCAVGICELFLSGGVWMLQAFPGHSGPTVCGAICF